MIVISSRGELEPESPAAEGGTGVKDWLKQQPGRSIIFNIIQQDFFWKTPFIVLFVRSTTIQFNNLEHCTARLFCGQLFF